MAYDPVITNFNSARLANTPIPILRYFMDALEEVGVVHSVPLVSNGCLRSLRRYTKHTSSSPLLSRSRRASCPSRILLPI